MGELRRRNGTTFEATEEANARFRDRMTSLLDKTVLGRGDCATSRSYYFGPKGETLLRLTSPDTTMREQAHFPLSDYAIA